MIAKVMVYVRSHQKRRTSRVGSSRSAATPSFAAAGVGNRGWLVEELPRFLCRQAPVIPFLPVVVNSSTTSFTSTTKEPLEESSQHIVAFYDGRIGH
jgi:hypothetical protein